MSAETQHWPATAAATLHISTPHPNPRAPGGRLDLVPVRAFDIGVPDLTLYERGET